jgi:2'-5' RNA ligase
LFAALDLPAPISAGLAAWGARELADPALRPVAPEALHLTLCFLGHVVADRADDAAASVLGLRPRPVPMRLHAEPVARPPRRPRLFALEVDSPAAVELHDELAAALTATDLYEPPKRPFWPHLTVARVRQRGRRPRRVAKRPAALPDALVHTFASVRVALYRSNLRPEGAQYTSLANLNLPPAA